MILLNQLNLEDAHRPRIYLFWVVVRNRKTAQVWQVQRLVSGPRSWRPLTWPWLQLATKKSHFSFDQWNVITWFRVDHYVKQTSIKLKRREIVNSSLKFWLSERIEWKCFNRRKMRVSGTRGRIWKLISLAISSFSIDTQSGHIFTRLRLRHFRHCGKLPTGVRFLLSAAWKLGFDKVTWHLKRQSREGVFLTGRVPPVGLVTTLSKC